MPKLRTTTSIALPFNFGLRTFPRHIKKHWQMASKQVKQTG
jgi:hypothetical protein